MQTGIYSITNTQTGKCYIGSAVNAGERWSRHKHDLRLGKHHSKKLQHAWNKYGAESFEFQVVWECERKYLLFFEQVHIDGFGGISETYNIAPKAGSTLGVKPSPEALKRRSEYFKGRPSSMSAETRLVVAEKVRALKTGKKRAVFSEEWRKKLSDSLKGRVMSEEWKAKIGAKSRGRIYSAESRAKMSASHKGYKPTEEQVRKSAEARRGKKRGPYKTSGKYTYITRKRKAV